MIPNYTNNMSKKRVYLSIDDSPSIDFEKNVKYLLNHKIPAIFFCIGNLMEKHWDALKYAVQNGYIIGNHSFSHPNFSEISLDQAKKEIRKTDLLIEKLHQECAIDVFNKYFRFPYGDIGDGKFGATFMKFEEARTIRLGRLKKLQRSILMLSPMNRHVEESKEKDMLKNSRAIERYLYELGYLGPQELNINYDFFTSQNYSRAWSWTYDIGEWKWKEGMDKTKFLDQINTSFRNGKVDDDPRGEKEEKVDLKDPSKNELILFHDRPETNHLFEPIIDILLQNNVEFLSVSR